MLSSESGSTGRQGSKPEITVSNLIYSVYVSVVVKHTTLLSQDDIHYLQSAHSMLLNMIVYSGNKIIVFSEQFCDTEQSL